MLNAGAKWYFCIIFNFCTHFLSLLSPASIPLFHSCFSVRKKYATPLLSLQSLLHHLLISPLSFPNIFKLKMKK
ncbi:hypothetical protein PRUPE_3G072400 [Prunus persica]|uniref:Uncharacterized protein n=1 Tax=Prunus persica TaxID=3760 RepID=A0A251PWN3_PRUPE|nr:hypothetical protein PRUPE_3G072400 [Prunus persica]